MSLEKEWTKDCQLAEFDPPQKPLIKNSKIVILKIDPGITHLSSFALLRPEDPADSEGVVQEIRSPFRHQC